MRNRYLIVTPCRDEADFLQATIDSVAAQTVPPVKWVVVDDGSTDETPQILARAQERLPYLQVVRRDDRGRRAVGPGVVDAFYAGMDVVDLGEYDFVCKLDGDLEFPPRYFERLMEIMDHDPVLGNISGKLYLRYGDRLVEERLRDDNAGFSPAGKTSIIRSMVLGAELVCSVPNTRWPVSAAVSASRMVSRSRISPTRI
jgi:glycosyltransferase involved in cell wall biosynthesis